VAEHVAVGRRLLPADEHPRRTRCAGTYAGLFGDDVMYGDEHTFADLIMSSRKDPHPLERWAERAERVADRFSASARAAALLATYQLLS
jgi:hypothetical protein